METNVKSCSEACLKCAAECNQCYNSCLKNNTGSDKESCVTISRDCADICLFTVSMISRNSSYAKELIAICAKVCSQCAVVCKNSCAENEACSVDCKSCADTCSECADVCKNF